MRAADAKDRERQDLVPVAARVEDRMEVLRQRGERAFGRRPVRDKDRRHGLRGEAGPDALQEVREDPFVETLGGERKDVHERAAFRGLKEEGDRAVDRRQQVFRLPGGADCPVDLCDALDVLRPARLPVHDDEGAGGDRCRRVHPHAAEAGEEGLRGLAGQDDEDALSALQALDRPVGPEEVALRALGREEEHLRALRDPAAEDGLKASDAEIAHPFPAPLRTTRGLRSPRAPSGLRCGFGGA